MKQRFEGLVALSGTFRRTFDWRLTGKKQTLSGRMVLRKPDRFRFDSESQVLMADGITIWNYVRDNNQVVVNRYQPPEQDRSPEGLLFNLLFRSDYAGDYALSGGGIKKLSGRTCLLAVLTARSEKAYISSVRLWIRSDTWLPAGVEYADFNGDLTTYLLSDLKVHRDIPDSTFRFAPPPGVEVVDLGDRRL